MKKLILILTIAFASKNTFGQIAIPHAGQATGIVLPSAGAGGGGDNSNGNADQLTNGGVTNNSDAPPPPPPPPPPPVQKDTAYAGDTSMVFNYSTVSELPQFGGGDSLKGVYFQKSLHQPQGVQGIVYVAFVVEKNGAISNVHLKKGIDGSDEANNEAIRVVQNMPHWKAGKKDGKTVRTRMIQQVKFGPQ